MITENEKDIIINIAGKYKVSRLFLFGSNVNSNREAQDIDLAVEGLPEKLFFKFYSELIFNLSKPVDLIDIGKKSRFSEHILENSVNLYG